MLMGVYPVNIVDCTLCRWYITAVWYSNAKWLWRTSSRSGVQRTSWCQIFWIFFVVSGERAKVESRLFFASRKIARVA